MPASVEKPRTVPTAAFGANNRASAKALAFEFAPTPPGTVGQAFASSEFAQ